MLPNLHHQRYQEFKQALEQLQKTAASSLATSSLRQSFLVTQQFFQQQIVSLDPCDLEPALEARVRSYQTEMSKQLQLLGMDVTFLQAARQPTTAKSRQMQLEQRIQTLISYCDSLLELN